MAKKLTGRFDGMAAATLPPEVEVLTDKYRITVKVEDWEDGDDLPEGARLVSDVAVWYSNEKESYEFHKVPSLATALQYLGAELSDDQIAFLSEALKGNKAGPAVAKLVAVFNSDLKATAKANSYSRLLAEKSPQTDESVLNSKASMVRQFAKMSGVSAESAIESLKTFNSAIFGDYTIEEFKANKSKR